MEFPLPQVEAYDGRKDPLEHIMTFKLGSHVSVPGSTRRNRACVGGLPHHLLAFGSDVAQDRAYHQPQLVHFRTSKGNSYCNSLVGGRREKHKVPLTWF